MKNLKKERLEQLRPIFKATIEELIEYVESGYCARSYIVAPEPPPSLTVAARLAAKEQYIKKTINKLVYEVKIRINNKKGGKVARYGRRI